MSAFRARDYQGEDVEKIYEQWNIVRSTLAVLATGLGKTQIAAMVVKRMLPGRTIFLCHRSELISQAFNTFERHGISCDIEKADQVAGTNLFTRGEVVLATVQTLNSGNVDRKRMQRFRPRDFALLVYDESHHSVSKGNKSIVDYFVEGNPQLKVLGLTATPSRADEEALGQIFESVATERNILFGIREGWLVPIEQQFVTCSGLDWSHIKTQGGDLHTGELSKVMESEEGVQSVVQPTIEALYRLPQRHLDAVPVPEWGPYLNTLEAKRRKAIVFTVSVHQAEMLSGIFNRILPDISLWVCGKTNDERRAEIFDDFKDGGKASILVNCGVTTEGYDNPHVDMIVMARPTKSHTLYVQMIGRGTRVLPGLVENFTSADGRLQAIGVSKKPALLVLDLVGNSGKHILISSADMLGGIVSPETVEKVVKKAKEEGKPVRMMEALEEEEKNLQELRERARQAEDARRHHLVARVRYDAVPINPFSAMSLSPTRHRGWDNTKPLSPKQRAVLLREGVDCDVIGVHASRQLLYEIFRRRDKDLALLQQCRVIKKYYPDLDTKNLSMADATKYIAQLNKDLMKVRQDKGNQ